MLYIWRNETTQQTVKKKTPIQKLIDKLNGLARFIGEADATEDKYYRDGLREAIEEAESLLEEEKKAMCEFTDEFTTECINSLHEKTISEEEFFDLTFNTNDDLIDIEQDNE